jgi:hypothetical protein
MPDTSGSISPGDGGAVADGGVVGNVTSISLSQTDVHIPVGTNTAFAVTATFTDGSRRDVTTESTATSSNTSVATVANGPGSQIQIYALSPGTATIAVTFGTLKQDCAVTVTQR